MKRTIFEMIGLTIVLLGLAGCSTVPSGQTEGTVTDKGYFLSWDQKGQLIWRGQIQDASGNWYDIWVVPGYKQPAHDSMRSIKETGSAFGEYFGSEKYEDLGDATWECLKWGYRECVYDFIVEGTPKALDNYWSTANKRTEKRVFGWWFAYPWAFMESMVDTVVRVPAGLTGMCLGTAAGIIVVPSYYAVNSTIEGTWYLSVDALLLPSLGWSWNTVISPTMALVGQKPAPSRVDGFWVKRVTVSDEAVVALENEPLTQQDVETLVRIGSKLLQASKPFSEEQKALWTKSQEEHRAIDKRMAQATKDIRSREAQALQTLLATPALQEAFEYLRAQKLNAKRIRKAEADIRRYVESQKEMPKDDVQTLISLLRAYAPSSATNLPPHPPKTNPVEHSLDVIENLPK